MFVNRPNGMSIDQIVSGENPSVLDRVLEERYMNIFIRIKHGLRERNVHVVNGRPLFRKFA